MIVGQDRFTEQRLGNRCAQNFGGLQQLEPRARGALPGENGDLAAGVENLRRPRHIVCDRGMA